MKTRGERKWGYNSKLISRDKLFHLLLLNKQATCRLGTQRALATDLEARFFFMMLLHNRNENMSN